MKKSHFEFKLFTICHDRCAMKVGTDGVLLGAWTEITPDISRILDIGTGSGLIAIMLAQKCDADITGIDIDSDAIGQAIENGEGTRWSDRLRFLQDNILNHRPDAGYHLIVCNPPFFENALLSPDEKRSRARHCDSLPFDGLIRKAYELLEPDGLFNVVLPATTAEEFAFKAWETGLNLYKKCVVHTRPAVAPKRTLLSLKKGHASYPETLPLYIYNEDGTYTEEYRHLTEEYYLHF